jgi:hypothetical protein
MCKLLRWAPAYVKAKRSRRREVHFLHSPRPLPCAHLLSARIEVMDIPPVDESTQRGNDAALGLIGSLTQMRLVGRRGTWTGDPNDRGL